MTTDLSTKPDVISAQDEGTQLFERLARDPNVSVEHLKGLMELWERAQAKRAEAAFDAAMNAAQEEMRPVSKDAANPQTASKYASYGALDAAIRPIYTKHGFAVSFDTGVAPGPDWVQVVAFVTAAGHKRTYHIDLPADGKGAKGGDVMTKTHAVGSATSYGKRFLLTMVFNIATIDDDGNAASVAKVTTAPPGFEAWVTTLEAEVPKGTAAMMKAFNAGSEEMRKTLALGRKQSWESLKTRAAEATKAQGAKR